MSNVDPNFAAKGRELIGQLTHGEGLLKPVEIPGQIKLVGVRFDDVGLETCKSCNSIGRALGNCSDGLGTIDSLGVGVVITKSQSTIHLCSFCGVDPRVSHRVQLKVVDEATDITVAALELLDFVERLLHRVADLLE